MTTTPWGDRPAYVDPVDTAGGEVGDAPAPRWFRLIAVVLLGLSGYYAVAFADGPELTSPHVFIHGVEGAEVPEGEVAPAH